MQIAGRQWAVAFLFAALAHLAVGTAILWQPPRSGAQSAGAGGVEVSLGPSGASPGSEAQAVEAFDEISEVTAADASPVPPDEVEVSEDIETARGAPPAEAVAEEVPVEPAELIPDAEAPQPVEEAQPVEAVEPETVEAVETVEPVMLIEEVPEQEPESAETITARAVEPPPSPRTKPSPPEPEPAQKEPNETEPEVADTLAREPAAEMASTAGPEDRRATADSATGAGGKSGASTASDAGEAEATSGGGVPGVTEDYMAVLQAWLERHKEYPRRARMRRQEGVALLYFVMDRKGRVLDYRVEESSGHSLLDREVAAMIERAQPLPEMPDDLNHDRLELVVPVQFSLR